MRNKEREKQCKKAAQALNLELGDMVKRYIEENMWEYMIAETESHISEIGLQMTPYAKDGNKRNGCYIEIANAGSDFSIAHTSIETLAESFCDYYEDEDMRQIIAGIDRARKILVDTYNKDRDEGSPEIK